MTDDMVNQPPHYNHAGIECIEAIEAALKYKNKFGAKPLRGLARMASLMSNTIIPKTLVEQVTKSSANTCSPFVTWYKRHTPSKKHTHRYS